MNGILSDSTVVFFVRFVHLTAGSLKVRIKVIPTPIASIEPVDNLGSKVQRCNLLLRNANDDKRRVLDYRPSNRTTS